MMTKVFTYFLIFFGVIGIVFLHNDFFRTDKYKQGVLKNNSNPVRSTENANICDIPTAKGLVSLQTVEKNIYNPIGYSIKQYIAPLAVVGFIEEPTCSTIFSEWAEIAKTSDPNKVPPRLMPSEIRNNYTLDGYEFTMMGYADDRGVDSPSKWNRIDHYIKSDHKDIYAGEGQAMFFAMKYHGVKGMKGFTVGSINPWLEGFALRLGAEHITTLEYRTLIISGTEKVSWVHPNEFVKHWANYAGQFDFGASFSSIEHSGLGRFTDALDPIGDLREMLKARCLLKPGGLFFLGVPVGADTIYFNLHRIYGRIRLALMFAGFEVLDVFYKDGENPIVHDKSVYNRHGTEGKHWQPVFALRKV